MLPEVLGECGEVDMFVHDSERTYENMFFEYRTVWPYLSKGGMLLSHDASWNDALTDFAHEVHHEYIAVAGLGVIAK